MADISVHSSGFMANSWKHMQATKTRGEGPLITVMHISSCFHFSSFCHLNEVGSTKLSFLGFRKFSHRLTLGDWYLHYSVMKDHTAKPLTMVTLLDSTATDGFQAPCDSRTYICRSSYLCLTTVLFLNKFLFPPPSQDTFFSKPLKNI